MGPFLRYCFWTDREDFLNDLRPKYIIPSLISDQILTREDAEDILSENTSKLQVIKLIDILGKKGSQAFDSFVNALNEDDAYPWLAKKLIDKRDRNNNKKSSIEVQELHRQLAIGGVPFQTNYFFQRDSELYKIKAEIMKASGDKESRRWWIVLHGMLGCGKSVLAAEALRDTYIFQECFSSGVCWIPIGNIQDKAEITLLHKLQILWERLESNNTSLAENREALFTNPDKEKVKKYLRAVFADQEKCKFLIVLDDVWEPSVIEAFDLGCPIMITTRNINVVDKVSAYCSFIPFNDGLNSDETRQFLSLFVKTKAEDLPKSEINVIQAKSKGLPLTLSLIGSMMLPFGNKLKRWQDISRKIGLGVSDALTRNRRKSGESAYLKDMIEFSMSVLDEEIKEHYLDFAIFEEDVFVPSQVFEILWDKNNINVEDIMHELYQKSLVTFEEHPESDSYTYSVHDLYLDYLKDTCGKNNDLEARHKRLVDRYMELCKTPAGFFNFDLLPNDGYIHYYIGYHIHKAGLVEYFKDIFLDFSFIQNKLHFAGSSDLLYDFATYKAYFVDVLKEMQDIEAFIRRNAHLLCNKDADIIQLALFEPSSSTVYKNAKAAALLRKSKIYFEWSNQGDVPYLSILNTRLGFDDLRCTAFNPEGDIVATVGEDTSIMLWDSTSGKEFDKLQGHFGSINCCSFNSNGSSLVTGSADTTVRLWDIDPSYLTTKRGSKTKRSSQQLAIPDIRINDCSSDPALFTCHESEVFCCDFSPNNQLVISGDSSGFIYVWEVQTKEVIWKFSHDDSSRQIMCCHFSHDNDLIATASGKTIKIWNVMSKSLVYLLDHQDDLVIQFNFSKNNRYIYSVSTSAACKWDIKINDCQTFFGDMKNLILCCCQLSPNELFLASGTSDFSVIVWSTTSLKPVANLRGHKNSVQSVAYSQDGTKLLSASSDGHIIVWDMSACTAISMVSLESNLSVKYLDHLVISSSDHLNCIQVRTGFKGTLKQKSDPDPCDITSCSLSDDCSEVIYGTKSGAVKRFILETEATESLRSHAKQITYLMHLKNSHAFVSCSEDGSLRLWNGGREFNAFNGHRQSVVMCLLFNDDKKILSCSDDGTLRIWSSDYSEDTMVLEGHGNQKITFCDVSTCERYLCSASSDCTIMLWNAFNGQELRTLLCEDCVRCCRFSPIPGLLVSGEDSGEVKIWEIHDSNLKPKSIGSHDSWVKAIRFSSNGSQFVTVSDSIKLWAEDGSLAQTIVLPGAFTCALWASPDFKMFVLVHNSVLYILKSVV